MATSAVYVGTSGWSYPSGFGKWKGVFYPRRWSGDELSYYAERFPAVEVNSTFYRMPPAETARGWAERTPAHFRFAVKLYRKFTHPEMYVREEGGSPTITAEDIAAMTGVLDALATPGRLGALLVQYADHLRQNETTLATLVRTLDAFRGYPLVVELRHRSWLNDRTLEVLGHFQAGLARIDEPGFSTLAMPAVPEARVAYWRYHGRNAASWRQRGASAERYDYLYSAEEVGELASNIDAFVDDRLQSFAFFNNHPHGKAAANAVQLAERLGVPLPFQKFAGLAETYPALKPLTGERDGQLRLG